MAVPAHDTRDWEFAKKFNLPIIEVLKSSVDVQEEAWVEDGLHVNSGFIDGLNKEEAIEKMNAWLEREGLGHFAVNYKLRDWVFSRQRYWGEPIPSSTVTSVVLSLSPRGASSPPRGRPTPSGTGEPPLLLKIIHNLPQLQRCHCQDQHYALGRFVLVLPPLPDPHNT